MTVIFSGQSKSSASGSGSVQEGKNRHFTRLAATITNLKLTITWVIPLVR